MFACIGIWQQWRGVRKRSTMAAVLLLLVMATSAHMRAQMASAPTPPVLAPGLLVGDVIERLLPPSVYYKGQSAPLQLRNAAGFRSPSGSIAWMALVDTSGYSTGVREQYQFYLVTEAPLQFGDAVLQAGAYGAGFLADGTAVVLDLGAHEVARTPVVADASVRRPRPLHLEGNGPAYRLYLGKQYVSVSFKP